MKKGILAIMCLSTFGLAKDNYTLKYLEFKLAFNLLMRHQNIIEQQIHLSEMEKTLKKTPLPSPITKKDIQERCEHLKLSMDTLTNYIEEEKTGDVEIKMDIENSLSVVRESLHQTHFNCAIKQMHQLTVPNKTILKVQEVTKKIEDHP